MDLRGAGSRGLGAGSWGAGSSEQGAGGWEWGGWEWGPQRAERKERAHYMSEKQFRFEDLDVWKKGAALSGPLFSMAEELDKKRLYRFAEQLRAAKLSITNNIAKS